MADNATATETDSGQGSEEPTAKTIRFPTALTVLAIVLMAVWLASFFVPSGLYELDTDGAPIPGTYEQLDSCGDVEEGAACIDKGLQDQFQILWSSTPNGLYGIESVDDGTVGAFNEGFLYGSAQVFLFVLAVGAFITVTMKTDAIQVGIGRLAMRFRNSPQILVIVLMSVFALGGTTYGMWEETLGFYVLMVPLVLALGYDRIVAVSIIFLGAGTGVLASTVNPFATGVASDAAGIEISDGIAARLIMLFILVPTAILYVLWYGRRVQNDPSKSLMPESKAKLLSLSGEEAQEVEPLTSKHKYVLALFFLAFAIMIFGFIPWEDVWQNVFNADWPLFTMADILGDFYFTEASVLFIVFAVVIGLIAGLGESGTVDTIVAGAADFLGAALVIVVARGITVVMKNTYITDTILNTMENAVEGTDSVLFAWIAFVVNIPIAFLVPSSSGHAALVMPILAPVSDFADVPRSISVTAYQSASGFVNLITPTSAIIMGGLTLAKVGYDKYVRFVVPYLAILFVLVSAILMINTAIA